MAFNFKAAEAQVAKSIDNKSLALMLLGQSGSGKSYVLGTFGVPTLYLFGTGESHGPQSARTVGGANVLPVCWDQDDEGKALTHDLAYRRLLDALGDVDGIKEAGFGAVAIDGATELEQMIRKTKKWEQLCQTDKGKHNNFAESDATKIMFRPVLDALKALQTTLGLHYAMSCILDIKQLGDNGGIQEASPKLSGYGVAENLIQQFPDIVALGRMSKDDKIAHRLQFLASVTRVSKDLTGTVKKTMNFNPRITGFKVDELPETFDPNLAKLAKFKARIK
jgi:hypothetical protein